MTEKPKVLFVDDEERILRSLKMLFRSRYDVMTTTSGHEALELLRREPIHVLVSDQRMPAMTGVDLLRQARQVSPNTMRLLLTGYSELDAIVGSINEGEVFRFINKPWSPTEITELVGKAAEVAHRLFEMERMQPLAPPLPKAGDGGIDSGTEMLVLDSDPATRDAVDTALRTLGQPYVLHWGRTVEEAFRILAEHDIAVLFSEVFLGEESIIGALKLLKRENPELVTLVLTSFEDTRHLIELINQGQIYRFLPKPVGRGLLARSISAAVSYHYTLDASPALAARHNVEPSREESDGVLAERVRGFLERLRRRPGAAALGSPDRL